MQPESEISVLDWLKAKLSNPRELFQRANPAIAPSETIINAAPESPTIGDSGAGFLPEPTPAPETPPLELEQAEPTSHSTRIKISTAIPHGSTLTITLRADEQGHVTIVKNAEAAHPVRMPQVTVRLPNPLNWLKRLNDFIESMPVLLNGLLFSAIALLIAISADSTLRDAKSFTDAALGPMLWAGFLFTWAVWAIHKGGSGLLDDSPGLGIDRFTPSKRKIQVAVGLIIGAAVLVLWVARDAAGGDLAPGGGWMLIRWAIALVLMCIAAWLLQDHPQEEKKPASGSIWPTLGVAGIVLVAFAARFWQVSSIPFTLGGDEGEQGVEILRILNGTLTNPFVTGWYSVPTFDFFFNAPTVALFGHTTFGLRLTWVLAGTASILATYLLVKELKGTRLALITAALLATYHYHIHYSRLGSMQVSDTLLVALTLLFLYRGYSRGKWLDWALAGVIAGIGQYFYAGARLALILALFLAIYLWVRDGFKITRTNRVGLGIFMIAVLIAGWPMFSLAMRHPDIYNARANQIGILQNGWLANEAIKLGKTQAEILLDQFWRSVLAFNAYPDRVVWYGLSGPLLDSFSGSLFLIGAFSATLWSIRDRRLAPMVAWWWSAILTGGMLTDTTPSSQRLITVSVPTMFFVAWVIENMISAINQRFPAKVGLLVGSVTVLLASVISLNLYFNEYTPKRIYGGEHAMIATMLAGHITEDLGPNWQVYFFGAPRMYINIGTMRFLVPDLTKTDIETPLQAPFDPGQLSDNINLLFVFLPERSNELQWVWQTFPNGQVEEVRSPIDPDRVLYVTYTIKRDATP
jgi:4-amino-4-deoxy-L-arabinose transferase-like glycosyltransferase